MIKLKGKCLFYCYIIAILRFSYYGLPCVFIFSFFIAGTNKWMNTVRNQIKKQEQALFKEFKSNINTHITQKYGFTLDQYLDNHKAALMKRASVDQNNNKPSGNSLEHIHTVSVTNNIHFTIFIEITCLSDRPIRIFLPSCRSIGIRLFASISEDWGT